MQTFVIILENERGCQVEKVIVEATDGTQALKKYLELTNPIIEIGDSIKILDMEPSGATIYC